DLGWEVAGHSVDHNELGWKTPKGSETYANTEEDLIYETTQSKLDIQQNLTIGDEPVDPIAFVHPHNDATLRSVSVAMEAGYPLVFTAGYGLVGAANRPDPTPDDREPYPFVGRSSDVGNGELVRILAEDDSRIADPGQPTSFFEKRLMDA